MDAVHFDMSLLSSPPLTSMDFHDSTFFQTSIPGAPVPELPTPAAVLEASSHRSSARGIVRFDDLNLFVKYGPPSYVRVEEALALRAVNKAFPDKQVPTPELFGWRVDGGKIFIYMGLVQGPTVSRSWETLTREDKESICEQLGQIIKHLRRIIRPSHFPLVGSINGGPVQDLYFRGSDKRGPFSDVKAFHDTLQAEAIPRMPVSERPPDPYRCLLPDTVDVYFTHGDLNLGNIMLSDAPGPKKIVAIVDWEQAGWYPEHWEYCKLLLAEPCSGEWRVDGWADKVVTPREEEFEAFGEYWHWRQP
ncbi:kinase-like protein [Daldinia loculata]|uniref:kinase-like protein n=1 Tax=Daldinia loculata TaxID=103429 RepID=UPI0020C433D1|nr:kinase-like protein [Daldinia loculata]KAI1642837.1 kinase-like protein [Daldinia loculata]